jgi:hypothetical protein
VTHSPATARGLKILVSRPLVLAEQSRTLKIVNASIFLKACRISEVRSLDNFESAFARAKKERSQALITTPGPLVATQQRQVLDFAAESRLPAMYSNSEFVEAGGLMSYAPNYMDLFRRTADLVDKI